MAEQKGLTFKVDVQPDVPPTIYTDGQRLQQVLKNLLSNAFKFTAGGRRHAHDPARREGPPLRERGRSMPRRDVIAFAVSDTGIGIPKDKQQLIFEAFQQADGTTSRKFGGTGLGLSISREIARLLGGEIRVESAPGKGSTFTLFLPARYVEPAAASAGRAEEPAAGAARADGAAGCREPPAAPAPATPGRPRGRREHRRSVDQDATETQDATRRAQRAARDVASPVGATIATTSIRATAACSSSRTTRTSRSILLDMAREKGFKGIVALDGERRLELAHEYQPDAITLDIDMPGMDGWAVLDRLKHHPDTRHIPVHIISGIDKRQQGLKAGAIAYLEKPVSKEALDDAFARISTFIDERVRSACSSSRTTRRSATSIVELIGARGRRRSPRSRRRRKRCASSRTTHFDCMVLDLGLSDMSGFELLER